MNPYLMPRSVGGTMTTAALVVIYNCRHCKTGLRREYSRAAEFHNSYRIDSLWGKVRPGVWIMSTGRIKEYHGDPDGICGGCGRAMLYGELEATLKPDIRCGSKCRASRGPSCDCSCGGENHGRG